MPKPKDLEAALAVEMEPEAGAVSEELRLAGEEFAAAVKSGDGARVVTTYKALKTLCAASETDEEEY